MDIVTLPSRSVPVLAEADICVAGGSCTGVFAAVTAARRGARVAVVEPQNRFGGTATASQVCYWHSIFNLDYSRQIIAGMTDEILHRLDRRGQVDYADGPDPSWYARLNTEELAIELDELVVEAGVLPFLHSRAVDVWRDADGRPAGLLVAGKGGLGVLKAKYLVDATGDGDICAAAGAEMWRNSSLQPPTACAKMSRWPEREVGMFELGKWIHAEAERYHMPEGMIWGCPTPGKNTFMLAGTKIPDADLSDPAELTAGEIEGRRQIRAIQDIVAGHGLPRPVLEALPSLIGIRDTRHIRSLYRLTTDDVLYGREFPDTIARGTYRVDVHSQNPPGTRFLYLDGTEVFISPDRENEATRWRPEGPAPECYSIPLRSLIPAGFDNLISAGRMIDAETGAYGAVRVMVTMNQTGEAAGNAAYEALDKGTGIPEAAGL